MASKTRRILSRAASASKTFIVRSRAAQRTRRHEFRLTPALAGAAGDIASRYVGPIGGIAATAAVGMTTKDQFATDMAMYQAGRYAAGFIANVLPGASAPAASNGLVYG